MRARFDERMGEGVREGLEEWVEGDVEMLRQDLNKFLFERYEQEFISQPNEFMQKVVFRGNFDADFKEFLKMKGF